MAKFNHKGIRPRAAVATATSPLATVSRTTPDTRTFEGASGWARTPRTELFLLATGSFLGNEDTFYESGETRDERLRKLVHLLAVEDFTWLCRFTPWLRKHGNMRTAALMVACEAVKARLDAGYNGAVGADVPNPDGSMFIPTSRWLIDAACQRADEPGETIAYWMSQYGRKVPKPVKRGVADAAARLYTQRSLLKYDTVNHPVRFGDVLELCHPSPAPDKASWQGDLFQHAIDRRQGRDDAVPGALRMLRQREQLAALTVPGRRALLRTEEGRQCISDAGMTWESLAGWLQGPMDKEAWEAIIPSMGYMALLRNLRNFDEAGVSDEVANQIVLMLRDPEQVANSRQLPFRFYSAYKHAPFLRWAYALETALGLSLANVPFLSGRTLILVDRSPSMFPGYGYSTKNKSDITLADQAALFGSALALRAEAPTLIEFGGSSKPVSVPKGGSVLKMMQTFSAKNDGTDIPSAVKQHYDRHDRVIVVTDEQTQPGYFPSNMQYYGGMEKTPIDALVPLDVPVYMWNLAGYKPGAMATGSACRFTLGGLTDSAFTLIHRLEAGLSGTWPWETKTE